MELGYSLSSEEHRPLALVEHARRAEEAGFSFALVSDHFHPWIDRQGESPFVWGVLGGIALATDRLIVGTGVTCPTIRIHPAVVAQAAATAASMLPGRFFLGVGTGENLNEHVLGDRWPPADVRLEMLEEAIDVMRSLWEGGLTDHRGRYYTVENARIYTLPEEPIPVMVAAGAKHAAELAGRVGDGFVGTSPDRELLNVYEAAGGGGKPRYGQLTVCFAESESEARRTAHELWPTAALKGPLAQELALPAHFEAAAEMVSEDDVAEQVVCGPDPERHVAMIEKYAEAGYDHVYVHQVGADQEGFLRFYESEILPRYAHAAAAR
ncbi:MAG: TIGR03557 family F420-dependent LLM class oxidoreductase [Actinomycetota bacterium]|jgi:G6PDH family F420-dependent oxidoreductase|nr:TIGR03557 family F420-dependent LLM class oxidoreductase [Actinomycetota bacterium]